MKHTLSVLVQIDLDGTYIHILVTGCLTVANQHALHPVIARAQTLIPAVHVKVDLDSLEHLEPAAVTLLRAALHHDHTATGLETVNITVPSGLRVHPPVRELPTRPLPNAEPLPALAA